MSANAHEMRILERIGPTRTLDRYRLVRLLRATEAMEHYLAIDEELEREVAVTWFTRPVPREVDAALERAGRLLALHVHPNVVTLHHRGRLADGTSFLVTGYVPGPMLAQVRLPVPWTRALDWACELAGGLAVMHARGALHRNLSPASVRFSADGHPVLMDPAVPGVWKDAAGGRGDAAREPGIEPFVAPECLDGAAPTARSDVFSLAAVVAYATLGRSPDADVERALRARARSSMARVLARCLERDPDRRLESARALRDSLLAVQAERRAWLGRGLGVDDEEIALLRGSFERAAHRIGRESPSGEGAWLRLVLSIARHQGVLEPVDATLAARAPPPPEVLARLREADADGWSDELEDAWRVALELAASTLRRASPHPASPGERASVEVVRDEASSPAEIEHEAREAPAPGAGEPARESAPEVWAPPEMVEFYAIERVIGRGGMGSVYLARDVRLERPVALKVITRGVVDDRVRERCLREARSLARVRHPNVVMLFRFGTVGDRPYLAYELVEGRSLDAHAGALSWRAAMRIGIDVASGTDAVHRAGVLHRDIKPSNVMLQADGTAKLIDFGVARISGDLPCAPIGRPAPAHDRGTTETAHGALVGTPRYLAPELWNGAPASPETDIYAIGLLMRELCAKPDRLAWVAAPRERARGLVPTRSLSSAPSDLCAVLDRCVETDPALRFRHAREIVDALREIDDAYRTIEQRSPEGASPALERSLPAVLDHLETITARVLTTLRADRPQLAPLLPSELTRQRRKVAFAIRWMIDALGAPQDDDLQHDAAQLGHVHAAYGVAGEAIRAFFEHTVQAIITTCDLEGEHAASWWDAADRASARTSV